MPPPEALPRGRGAAGFPAAGARVAALDVTRAVAIIGMLVVNIAPKDAAGPAGWIVRASHGRASILFVLLAGVGISLLTRRALTGGSARRGALLWRAGLLLILGLALQLLEHDVAVILPTYAVLFLVATALVRVSNRVLLALTAVGTVLGPIVWILSQAGGEFDLKPVALTDPPLQILTGIMLSGAYPVVTWLAPFTLGLWVGRLDLTDRAVQLRLLVSGTVAAVVGILGSRIAVAVLGEPGEAMDLDRLTSAVGHSQMPPWLISASGLALAVLGALLFLVPHLGVVAAPLVALGQLALTVYVGHLLVLAWWVRPGPWTAWDGLTMTAVMVVGATALAMVWLRFFQRGPLETLLRLPSRRLTRSDPR